MSNDLTAVAFVGKWTPVTLAERAASHEHFIDLCNLLGQPTPAAHDATGSEYAFEKGVAVSGPASRTAKGKSGFADVWWRGKFAWEYKRKDKHRSLDDAVLAAYASVDPEGEWNEDWAEVWKDSGAGQPLAEDHPLSAKRKEVDEQVLANLLRMNLARSAPPVETP